MARLHPETTAEHLWCSRSTGWRELERAGSAVLHRLVQQDTAELFFHLQRTRLKKKEVRLSGYLIAGITWGSSCIQFSGYHACLTDWGHLVSTLSQGNYKYPSIWSSSKLIKVSYRPGHVHLRCTKSHLQSGIHWAVSPEPGWLFWLCDHHGHTLPSPQTSQGQFLGNDSHFTREKNKQNKTQWYF